MILREQIVNNSSIYVLNSLKMFSLAVWYTTQGVTIVKSWCTKWIYQLSCGMSLRTALMFRMFVQSGKTYSLLYLLIHIHVTIEHYIIPRLLHADKGEISASSVDSWISIDNSTCGEEVSNSVLSTLIFNLLFIIQDLVAEMHYDSWIITALFNLILILFRFLNF